ncbi:leukocyte-associated immunoglobulin-like receptor 1 [Phocoena phocoena]|uniref:leukocyte-associated immunoglobulin-like receptor 1 n=1 Tax=Phocoena phocoena TaxID=9742 RepID=UPI003306D2E9
MSPHPTNLLGLVLCLGHTMHTQAGTIQIIQTRLNPRALPAQAQISLGSPWAENMTSPRADSESSSIPPSPSSRTLPSRSTRAEPDSVSPQGWPVTIVCRGPAGAEEFRLERKEDRSDFKDEKTVSQIGPHETEARFGITAVSGDTAQHYQCLYRKGGHWSEPSEPLELVVTGEEVSALPSVSPQDVLESAPIGDTLTPSTPSWGTDPTVLLSGHRSSRLPTEHLYILIGVPVAFLLCLLLLGLFLLHRRHERKRGPPRSKGEEQRPQERLSLADDVADGTPDLATVDRLPEKSGEVDTSAAAARGPQEVIYAQLDHPALTQRVGRAVSPLSTEPTAKSSMYAALARN